MSPAAAVRVLGMNVKSPDKEPTRTTWVLTDSWAGEERVSFCLVNIE